MQTGRLVQKEGVFPKKKRQNGREGRKEGFRRAQLSVFVVFCHNLPFCLRPPSSAACKRNGKQAEGFPVFGYAATGGRGIQYKWYFLLEGHF